MTRVVAGSAGGRRLVTPTGRDTRPTSDRVREALFGALGSRRDLAGSRFLDLYAGSGAVGLEARSRGAAAVLLVESHPPAVRAIRANIAALGFDTGIRLTTSRVERVVSGPADRPYDLVFADPPYSLSDAAVAAVLADLSVNGWLAATAVVVVERSTRSGQPPWPPGLAPTVQRKYGETTLHYAERDDEMR